MYVKSFFAVAALATSFTVFACTSTTADDEAAEAETAAADEDEGEGESAGEEGGEGDEGGVDEDDGDSFITEPDGGVIAECDPGRQDCPNEDEKCSAKVTNPGDCCVDVNVCVPITGTKTFGETCTREGDNDDCDKGLFCMTSTSGAEGEGVCMELCDVVEGQCENGGECLGFNDGVLPICQLACDPLVQDCPTGQGCYRAFDRFVCARPGIDDGGQDGDTCQAIQTCAPGLFCAGGAAQDGCDAEGACCTPFCNIDNDGEECLGDGEQCVPFFEDGTAPPGLEKAGGCVIPE